VKLGDADRMIVDVISTGSLTLGEYVTCSIVVLVE